MFANLSASMGVLALVLAADPLSFGFAAVTLIAVALFAGYFPARRAAYTDPMVALRCE